MLLVEEKKIIEKLKTHFEVITDINDNYIQITIKNDKYYLASIYIEDFRKYNFIRCKHYILYGIIEDYINDYNYLISQLNDFIHAF